LLYYILQFHVLHPTSDPVSVNQLLLARMPK